MVPAGSGLAERRHRMKPPVLVVATASGARAMRAALGDDYHVGVASDPVDGRALAATGAFLAVVAEPGFPDLTEADVLEPSADPTLLRASIRAHVESNQAVQRTKARGDEVAALPYDHYIELARYASTRRYLMALLDRHGGSVTDAARGAQMKRESLHRLLRKHHLVAEDFRARS